MKTRLLTFFAMLREAGLPVTVSETLDAVNAVRVIGVERGPFRDSLAATLVKDESDRLAFDSVFDRCFPLLKRNGERGPRPERIGGGVGHGVAATPQQAPSLTPKQHDDGRAWGQPSAAPGETHALHQAPPTRNRGTTRLRALQTQSFEQMSPRDVQDCDELVADLAQRFRAHMARRLRNSRRGRLDIRRTLRRSISTGGVPLQPIFRQRIPGALDLVGLCDSSHSVVTATKFLYGLVRPAPELFRRVHLFAFVDEAIEISIEGGLLVPHGHLDLFARSDFGRVLVGFTQRHQSLLNRNTIVLVLGDARNNRQPARADLLSHIRRAVRRVVWLNPEPTQRWNSGDSVIAAYSRHCDELFSAATPQQMYASLQRGLSVA